MTVLAMVLLGFLGGGILFWFGGLFYYPTRFAEHLRRHHPDVYGQLMGDDVRPVFLPILSLSLGGYYIPHEVSRFMRSSRDDLGDPKVAHLRNQYYRSLRNMLIWIGLTIIIGFPLVAMTHMYR